MHHHFEAEMMSLEIKHAYTMITMMMTYTVILFCCWFFILRD